MEMRYRLSCALVTGVEKIDAVIPAISYQMVRYFLHCFHQTAQAFLIAVQDILPVRLWNNQDMTVHILSDVHERKCPFVLINFSGRNLSAAPYQLRAEPSLFQYEKTE